MKATTRILNGLIAVALGLSVAFTTGIEWLVGNDASPAEAVAGQTTRSASEEARRQSDDLLQRARQAMAENDPRTAQSLLGQAEALGVSYSPLYRGDTPAKARRDLERTLRAADNSPNLSSRLFSPLSLGRRTDSVSDPFAARQGDPAAAILPDAKSLAKSYILKARNELAQGNLTAAAHWHRKATEQQATFGPNEDSPAKLAAEIFRQGGRLTGATTAIKIPPTTSITPLPSVGRTASRTSQLYGGAAGAGAASAGRSRSDALLLSARRALAEGDVRRATEAVEQAKALSVAYAPQDDSPAQVEAALRSYSDLIAQRTQRGHTEAYRTRYARILMGQAEGLLRYQDFDKAEYLATLAAQQGISFGPYQLNPSDLLQRIASARRQDRPLASSSQAAHAGFPAKGLSTGTAPSLAAAKQRSTDLVRQARAALAAGDLRRAESLGRQAQQLNVPQYAFRLNEDRPDLVLRDVQQAAIRTATGTPVGGRNVLPATGASPLEPRASYALYDQANDPTWNRLAAAQQPTPAAPGPLYGPSSGAPTSAGASLFQQGEAALTAHDPATAMDYFRQAAEQSDQLDPLTAQRLQDRLQLLRQAGGAPPPPSILDEAAASQQRLFQQVGMDLAHRESQANALSQTDPKGALALLEQARQMVEAAGLEPTARNRLLAKADRSLAQMREYVEQNRARIELEEKNQGVREEIERGREMQLDVQNKLANLVDEYNRLMDEGRFPEAEVVAKRAAELDPGNPFTSQLLITAKLVRRHFSNLDLRAQKEEGFWAQMQAVDASSPGFDDRNPIVFPDVRQWRDLSDRRREWLGDAGRRRTERELEIEEKLKTPVMLQFDNAPLSSVIDYLSRVAAVNVILDPQGLTQEGVTSDDPVTINLREEISLKSALTHILEPFHLSYVIKDDVLKITSEQFRQVEVYMQTYNVADLVMPIPNFIPSTGMGLAGAYQKAMGSVGFGGQGPFGGSVSPVAVVASRDGSQNNAHLSPTVLAQMQMPTAQPGIAPSSMPIGFGPGGLGGGTMADFDSLIDLIKTTVQPDTWDDVGGPGSIAPFETNLSIVVSQTQDVHDEIGDLLEQLRRMQDLQVTIEVRFITLNDNFFERIGIDFDFDIDDDIDRPFMVFGEPIDDGDPTTGAEPARNTLDVDHDDSVTVGLQAPGIFSADLDIPFVQNSFGLAVPQFGGFDASAGAQLGFAILSDIEAFFFVSAAQGDRRSNVLQAPKVTLFNGQMAVVSDTSQSPFVISVVPVVGDFAAAQQPVIVVLNEGTFLTVQAVVSNDRRFVRLTVVPFFSKIGEVNEFTFEGSQTTTDNTSQEGNQDQPDADTSNARDFTTTRTGTTVQLPTFSYISVTTTVSVPDGGTVLLGGIKRLSEGRNEFGVPILNKLPYINRLFKNVGIGRETQSLMMMVTPRIIIQEEEEERLGIL